MCLASVEVLFDVPIALYGISLQVQTPLNPYISWESVHLDFSRVVETPSLIWRSIPSEEIAIELSRWTVVFCAIVFFIFFGFADEAMKNYRYAFQSIAKGVGRVTGSSFGNGIDSSDFLGTDRCVNHPPVMFKRFFSLTTNIFFQKKIQSKIKDYRIIRENSSCPPHIRSQRDASTPRFHGILQQLINWGR